MLFVSPIATLGFAEAATRVLVPDPCFAFESRIEMFTTDARAGHWNRSDVRGYTQGTIRIRTDSHTGADTGVSDV